jgi:hypothetical protein
MKDKFTMGLVWHNCKTYPPKEHWNNNLYASDGKYVFRVTYDWQSGWFNKYAGYYIPYGELHEYWWADLEQTVQTSMEFADAQNKMIKGEKTNE